MKFKQKMLTLCCLPLIALTVLSLAIGLVQFRSGMYKQIKSGLQSSAIAAMNLYSSQGYGDYALKDDGNVWRGMNFNVSQEVFVVDNLKDQTGVDITFFYNDTAVMTSICNEKNLRWIGMKAGDNIQNYTIGQGADLWYRNIEIDGKLCHAYIIPVTQPGDGSVVGALMASESTEGFDNMLRQYILFSVIGCAVILVFVCIVIYWYIGGLTKVLHNVCRVLLKVSNGDLSDDRLKGSKRKDEFGELAVGTERLRVKVGNILNDTQDGIEQLGQAVQKLNMTSDRTTRSAKDMHNSVGRINETAGTQQDKTGHAQGDVELTNEAIDLMLQRIEDINQISGHMAELGKESGSILERLLESSQYSQQIVMEISGQAEVTNESVQNIKSVTEYITNIAEETNLLALNASIEAARAGEAGRGFAVVAQEIQKLAEESNRSAAQIGENIQSLVEKIEGILQVMDKVEQTLKTQEDNVQQTKEIFDELNQNIVSVTQKETDMQQNVSSMNTAKDNMSDIIMELAGFASDNARVSEDAQNATSQMMQEMGGLSDLVAGLTSLADSLRRNLDEFFSA